MAISFCRQVTGIDSPIISSLAGVAGAFITRRHRRASIKRQGLPSDLRQEPEVHWGVHLIVPEVALERARAIFGSKVVRTETVA